MTIFLESAELRVQECKDLNMKYWRDNVDAMLTFQNQQILKGAGSVSNQEMEAQVRMVYEDFDKRRKAYDALEADKQDMQELKELEQNIKRTDRRKK